MSQSDHQAMLDFVASQCHVQVKPVINYIEVYNLKKGRCAVIVRHDRREFITSTVAEVDPLSGRFETQNTIYLPLLQVH